MKKLVLILICIVQMTFFLTGCLVDIDDLLSEIEETNTSQTEEIPTYKIIITAIENKDFELFKSVYSNYALEYAVDIEEGFEYMCEIYTGEFQEITHSNTGGGNEYLYGRRGSIFNPSFGIRTDEKYYILRYSNWDFPDYKSVSGVYGVQLEESTKEDTIHVGGRSFKFPGVYYPENAFVDVIYGRIMHFLERMEEGKGFGVDEYNVNIKESMSDELLATDNLDSRLIDVQNYLEYFSSSNIEYAWRSKDLKQVYFQVKGFDSYIYIRLDDEQTDKIKVMQIVEIDGDKPIEEYDFKSEAGIYLPATT
ncbi:MAG: DUF5104 domain-containing protein [Acutalibacteraceae bacterium]|nr:DUF5104 domain-containing protein [Acutalibacteraceae bacterium]